MTLKSLITAPNMTKHIDEASQNALWKCQKAGAVWLAFLQRHIETRHLSFTDACWAASALCAFKRLVYAVIGSAGEKGPSRDDQGLFPQAAPESTFINFPRVHKIPSISQFQEPSSLVDAEAKP